MAKYLVCSYSCVVAQQTVDSHHADTERNHSGYPCRGYVPPDDCLREYLEFPNEFKRSDGESIAPEYGKAYTLELRNVSFRYSGSDEDGVEISGGEAQKIALARALYKNASFIILDEPTAALDPIAEYEVYNRMNSIIGDKTAVFISHRLSSCRFCGDIAVFHEGRLIQRGSHENLLADAGSKYYELWNAQAQYYQER